MARQRLDDLLQQYSFWVFDAGVLGGNILFPILDPSLAFSAVSAPEITAELKTIQPGNWEYKRQVVKTASVTPITLSRGTRFFDSDMYNWINSAIKGTDPTRRNLFMIHFLGLREGAGGAQVVAGAVAGAAAGVAGALAGGGGALGAAQAGVGGAVGGAILGSFIDNRIPGRCWVLHGCVPTRYKAGSDFDATSGDVSIQELEVQPEHIAEVTVSTIAPGIQGAVGSITGAVDIVSGF